VAQKQSQRAARLLGAAEALREATGTPMTPVETTEYELTLPTVRSRLGEATFNAAWAEGRALIIEQAIALALRNSPENP